MFNNLAKFDIYTDGQYTYKGVEIHPCTNLKGLETKMANTNFLLIKRSTGEEEIISTKTIKTVTMAEEAAQ